MQGSLRVLHLVAGIYGVIGGCRQMLVLLAIVVLLEHRLTGALDVAVEEFVGVGIFLLVQKPDAAVVEIGTDMSQILAVPLAELKVPPALLVGRSLYGVILKRHLEELTGVVEELRRIVLLLQIQFLVTEAVPDKKGRKNLDFRKGHKDYLAHIRSNLYNGGIWFLNKQKYQDAYKFFDCYIGCAEQPMFKSYNYMEKDKHLPTAAYYAVYSGYKMKDPKATLHHSYVALKDTVHYNYMLQYLAETYALEKDTARYVASLKEGFKRVPTFPFFFPRLVEHYVDNAQLDSAMVVVDEALTVVPDSDLYLAAKSNLLLDQGKLKECIEVSQKVIGVNPEMPEPYYNVGICYFNQAVEQDKNSQNSRQVKAQVEADYKKALPYLVKYRELEPKEQGKWAFPLYTIYLNLNMGKEFDEIDKVMRQSK